MEGFGNRRGRPSGPQSFEKPVKEGAEYDVVINEVGAKGDGIARIQGFVVFVTGAKQGERLRVKITRLMRNFAIAEKVGPAQAAEEAPEKEASEGAREAPEEAEETTETESSEEIEEIAEKDYEQGVN